MGQAGDFAVELGDIQVPVLDLSPDQVEGPRGDLRAQLQAREDTDQQRPDQFAVAFGGLGHAFLNAGVEAQPCQAARGHGGLTQGLEGGRVRVLSPDGGLGPGQEGGGRLHRGQQRPARVGVGGVGAAGVPEGAGQAVGGVGRCRVPP
jgi:hypothetical protein